MPVMTHPGNGFGLNLTIKDRVDLGYAHKLAEEARLKIRRDGDYLILDYTEKTQFHKLWNPFLITCRGLVTDLSGSIVSRPIPKFFNLGEVTIRAGIGDPLVIEKMDGSLIIVSQHYGKRIVSSRRSMHSPHVREAETILGDWMPQEGWTYCFELLHPDWRIVCDYGQTKQLILLAKIETRTGYEADLAWATEWPHHVPYYNLQWPFDPEEHATPNREGFVLFWPDSRFRIKVKFQEYLRLHKLMTGVTSKTVWEALRRGEGIEKLYERVPDEFYSWLDDQERELRRQFHEILMEAREIERPLRPLSRTMLALAIRDHPLKHIIFKLYDGFDPSPVIWEMLKPKSSKPFYSRHQASACEV